MKYDEYVSVIGARPYQMTLRDQVQVLSVFPVGDACIPASYLYENAEGQKFLVFTFDAYFAPEALVRQYTRSRQLADVIALFFGQPLPAYSFGNPDLYLLCKEGEGSLTVGLWNFFADSIMKPEVILGKTYKKITFINCTGELRGERVILRELQPYAFAGFEVE
ncbi:MAG: hypothetical protein J6C37_11290 [Roseburia sp.]|nr:hypothetical protein [Roseburia sp.]